MKKIVIIIAAVVMTVMMVFALTACYNSAHPGTMSQVIGTYELQTYKIGTPKTEEELSKKQSEDESNFNYTDKIQEKAIKCYLIVKDDGTGYYVYQDKDTPVYAKAVKITYTPDEEGSDKLTKIKYFSGIEHRDDDYPGCGEEDLGINAKTKTLNWYLGTYTLGKLSRKYTQTVSYKKVSDKTDLSYASAKLGKTLSAAPYELNALNGFFYGDYSFQEEGCQYIYYGINMRPADGKADVYYALKSDGESRVISDVNLTSVLPTGQETLITLTIGDNTYVTDYYGNVNETTTPAVPTYFRQEIDENHTIGFTKISGTISAWIEEKMQSYNDYLEWQSQQAQQNQQV